MSTIIRCWRDGLIAVLETQTDFKVVGQAGNGLEAAQKAAALRPDLVLLDLEMPEVDGVRALEMMLEENPDIRAIVFTAFDTDERILGAVKAGAQGYLLKGAARNQVFDAIRVVHRGGSLLEPVVASKLLGRLRDGSDHPSDVPAITPREEDVLLLVARGMQNKQIAAELNITERTVKFHVQSLLGKLGVANRTEAVAVAVQQGVIDL